jgi:DMSO/TMAO reductase YedYZ molybdopterin-dependent catalytic subunit
MGLLDKYNQSYINAKEQLAKMNKKSPGQSNSDLPPGQFLTTGFPTLDLGVRPEIPQEKWSIKVYGLVKNTIDISYLDLLSFPVTDITKDFNCVTRWTKRDVQWTGVQFKYIAEKVIPLENAKFVVQEGYDGYTTNLPLEILLQDNVILAYKLFGEPIPVLHGGLVRMIVPSRYGWKGSKFLNGIKFTEKDKLGFWETRGYNNNADYNKEERYS